MLTPADLEAIRALVREELAIANDSRVRKQWTPRPTESDRHRELVAELVAAGMFTDRLRERLEEIVGAPAPKLPKIVPDAFGANLDIRRIVVFEVCVSHWITRKKRAALREWRAWLAEYGWSLRLIKVTADRSSVGVDLDDGGVDDESMAYAQARLRGDIP